MKKVAVIGGGASGMAAAIAAAEAGADVTLYEKNERVGKKLLLTGNGRCNFSNRHMDASCYYGGDPERIRRVLDAFDTEAAVAFFERAGMFVKEKNGYLYPASGQASTVLDTLRLQLAARNVHTITQTPIEGVGRDASGRLFVRPKGGMPAYYDSAVIACGGKAAPSTGSDGDGYRLAEQIGHTIVPVMPALVQLVCRGDFLKSVAGVRQDAEVTLRVEGESEAKEQGELQITDYGISGIVVFQLSRLAAYALAEKKTVLADINFFPALSKPAYLEKCRERIRLAKARPGMTVEQFFTGMLNKKLMRLFIRRAGLIADMPYGEAERKKVEQVFLLCQSFELEVTACRGFESAQVCAGGVPLAEVSERLGSEKVPGIFFAGEVLDVDGKCGGYNLQWAWASGHAAGRAAAEQTD